MVFRDHDWDDEEGHEFPDTLDHAVNHLNEEVVGLGTKDSEQSADDCRNNRPQEDVVNVLGSVAQPGHDIRVSASQSLKRRGDQSGIEEGGDEVSHQDHHQEAD